VTVGVHENVVEASWHALVDALAYGPRLSVADHEGPSPATDQRLPSPQPPIMRLPSPQPPIMTYRS
jgi:hypothetical protein